MPMDENELWARDARRDIGAELLEAVRSVKAGKPGKVNAAPVQDAIEAQQRRGTASPGEQPDTT